MKIKLNKATGMLNKPGDTIIEIKKYKWAYGKWKCTPANDADYLRYDNDTENNSERLTIDEAKEKYGDWFLKNMDGVSEFKIYKHKNLIEQLQEQVSDLESDLLNSQTKWVRDEVATPNGYSCMQYEPFRLEVHYDELDEDGEYIDAEESVIDTIVYKYNESIEDINKKITAIIKEYEKENK